MPRAASLVSRGGVAVLFALATACADGSVSGVDTTLSLDAQVRQTIRPWGVVPILPVDTVNPALVDLGRSLFFDKLLSGNRDVSCASCHNPMSGTSDGLPLAVGTGAVVDAAGRTPGSGRQFDPRNAAPLFGASLRPQFLFWDGRVQDFGEHGPFFTPLGSALPIDARHGLAAQAMMTVLNRVEMRGNPGDTDVFGNTNELAAIPDTQPAAVWSSAWQRIAAVAAYVRKFDAAYPGRVINDMGLPDAANAIAAFEMQSFARTNSPFDRYLARDDGALTVDAKRGALLFFGRARCSQCHNGPLLGGQQFANTGVPQLGPGSVNAAPLDAGAGDSSIASQFFREPRFTFRVPPLRNVELTAPFMHDGVYATLEQVVRHYNNVDSAMASFDVMQLPAALRASYHGDATTLSAVRATLDGRVATPLALTGEQQKQLVAFLESLTDPSARNLGSLVPASVPSGLPVTP